MNRKITFHVQIKREIHVRQQRARSVFGKGRI